MLYEERGPEILAQQLNERRCVPLAFLSRNGVIQITKQACNSESHKLSLFCEISAHERF